MNCCSGCFNNKFIKNYITENHLSEKSNCPYCGSKNVNVIELGALRELFIHCIDKAYTIENDAADDKVSHSISDIFSYNEDVFSDKVNGDALLRDVFMSGINPSDADTDPYVDIDSERFYVKGISKGMEGSVAYQAWESFKYEAMHFNRYFDFSGEDRAAYLWQLNRYLRIIDIEKNASFYRARTFESMPDLTKDFDIYIEMGPPPAESVRQENRMSPAGIPYLYLSDDKNTALSECNDDIANVLVARFVTKVKMRIVDLSDTWRIERASIFSSDYDHDDYWINDFISFLVKELSRPVNKYEDASYEYTLTQLVAEYLRMLDYDGICYNSSKGKGKNYVFFYGPKSYEEYVFDCSISTIQSLKNFADKFDITEIDKFGNVQFLYKCPDWIYYHQYGDTVSVYNTEDKTQLRFNSVVKLILDEFQEYRSLKDVALAIAEKCDFGHISLDDVLKHLITFEKQLVDEKVLVRRNILKENKVSRVNEEASVHDNSLINVMFELTYRCQERCRHCYCVTDHPSKEEMSTLDITRTLDELRDMNVQGVIFTGGDPFARKDIFEILEHAHKNRFLISIFTNGTALSDSDILRLKELHIKDIHFSIYSCFPDKHDYITRREGSFYETVNVIKKCVLVGIQVNIKTPILNISLEELEGILKMAEDLGTTIQVAPSIMPKNDGDMSPTKFRLNNVDKYSHVFRLLDNHIKIPNDYDENPESGDSYQQNRICSAGMSSLSINPYGDVYPCNALLIKCGNIKSTSINEIWSNSETLKHVREFNFTMIDGCSNCKHKKYCNFCPGEALIEKGSPLRKYSEACDIAQARYKTSNQKKGGEKNENENGIT